MKIPLCIILLIHFSFSADAQSEYLPDLEAHFVYIIVKDIEVSINWYKDTLGFILLTGPGRIERGFSEARLKRGNVRLELLELSKALSLKEIDSTLTEQTRINGYFKVGFLIPDFDAWIAYLESMNIEIYDGVTENMHTRKREALIKDPDGNRILLMEK